MNREKFDFTEIILIVAIICVAVFTVCFVMINQMSKSNPEYDKAMTLAEQYFEAEKYDEAENAFFEAIEVEPKEADPYLRIAEIRFNQGNNDSAIEILDEAKQSDCNDKKKVEKLIEEIRTASDERDAVGVEDVDRSSLVDFFEAFVPYSRTTESEGLYYDYKNADPKDVLGSIMWNMQCVDYSIYPGEAEREEHWDGNSTDPLGWAADGTWAYYVYNADKVNWIASNIFNLTQKQINEASQTNKPGDSMYAENDFYYLNNGKYYVLTGGIGWETGYSVSIDSIKENNGYFDVVYTNTVTIPDGSDVDTEEYQYSAKMKYKEIDGEYYWSLYKHEEL